MAISEDKARIVIVVDKTTKEQLETLAKADSRSLSNYVNLILDNYVKDK